MSTLLREVIDIPESVGSDDYVLRLSDSTTDDAHIRDTLDAYVLTDSLKGNFASALSLVSDAITKNTSRAAFLNGSFGSGKSHFMAVLYALLGNHPAVRTTAYNDLTGQYDEQLPGKKILRLTYHLLGHKTMEEAIFRGYLQQIARLHPDAPLPAVHVTDSLIADAEGLRTQLGDAEFLKGLGEDADDAADDGWGGLGGGTWELSSYLDAISAPPEDKRRNAVVSALVRGYFGSFVEQAAYVDLDRGLVAISEHAKTLGYDAVVLFLDELVLWLAFSVTDNALFARESQKLTKLVESSGTNRPIPLVSFVSRQMDLRKWFADAGASGAEQEALDRAFEYQKGRFSDITLGDDNLSAVAHARLLRPKNAEAAAELAEAFRGVTRQPAVWDVLRDSMNLSDNHSGASEREFELTYPFSPALIATLRSLAAVMQRERTALKVMQRMLFDRRNWLTTADLIPVGDAFDYIVKGNAPIDTHAGNMFTAATNLYDKKLLPILLRTHSVTDEQLTQDPASVGDGFRAHERIAKTLLLSTVAPKVPALQDITASRLAALNHGSIKSKLRGGEARAVLAVVRAWAKEVPEIHVGDGTDPVISMQLSDVDYQSVLDRIRAEDNPGRRRLVLRTLIHRALGITADEDDLNGAVTRTIIWRGSRREVDIVFGNVRDPASIPEQNFDARPGTWKLIVDYPFDDGNFSAADDVARIDNLLLTRSRNTIVWLPKFFSAGTLNDLALLVKLDWLFTGTGDRWQANSDHLSATDRAQARGILENLHRGILASFDQRLLQAYGIEAADAKDIATDTGHTDVLNSLAKDFDVRLPVATSMENAFEKIIDQAFTATYPVHPDFASPGDEVTARQYEVLRGYVESAAAEPGGRVLVPTGADRKTVQRIAGPLRVGKATEDHYLFGDDTFAFWAGELDRAAAESSTVTVGLLRKRIEALSPAWGLRPEALDLVVTAWTLLRKRAWFEAGAPTKAPKLGALRDSIELRAEELPSEDSWRRAREKASQLFGYTMPRTHLTGANVAEFAETIRGKGGEKRSDLQNLYTQLQTAHKRLNLDIADGDRITAIQLLIDKVDQLVAVPGAVGAVDLLAEADFIVAPNTAGRLRSEAGRDMAALRSFQWKLIDPVTAGAAEGGSRGESARAIVNRLNELITVPGRSLADEIRQIESSLVDWVVDNPVTTGASPAGGSSSHKPSDDEPSSGSSSANAASAASAVDAETVVINPDHVRIRVNDEDDLAALIDDLRAAISQHGSRVRVEWWVEPE